jgi:hypothetical protein
LLIKRAGIGTSTIENANPVDRSFTEINNDTKSVDAMKVWLLKQTNEKLAYHQSHYRSRLCLLLQGLV